MGLTLQDVFCQHYPDYERTHPLPAHVRKAARAIMQCRTAALGGHIQACPEGHFSRIWYNSCRHRCCPQCAFIQTERWLAAQQARLLSCDHYHVIFTLPHDLANDYVMAGAESQMFFPLDLGPLEPWPEALTSEEQKIPWLCVMLKILEPPEWMPRELARQGWGLDFSNFTPYKVMSQ